MMATFQSFAKPPHLHGNYPKPVYYYNKTEQKGYFILTPHHRNTDKVYKYDMNENKYSILCSYPHDFEPNCHTQLLLPDTDQLYIFCGYHQVFGILHLDTLQWTIKCRNKGDINNINKYQIPILSNPQSIYISDAMHPIHMIAENRSNLLGYDMNTNLFIQRNAKNENYNITAKTGGEHLLYLNCYKQLILFDANNQHETLYCDIHPQQTKYEWKLFGKMSDVATYYNNYCQFSVCSVFDGRVIILFEYENDIKRTEGIWCLDVEEKKWIKTDIEHRLKLILPQMIKHENMLHIISCCNQEHFAINLLKIIPSSLLEKYKNRFNLLIYGYIAKLQQQNVSISADIPHDIVSLISAFAFQV